LEGAVSTACADAAALEGAVSTACEAAVSTLAASNARILDVI
jgi:hypothetical protein